MAHTKPMSKKEALALLKSIGYKERRLIEGDERKYMLTLFALLDPNECSNNQRTFTETYQHAGKEYELTWGFSDEGPEPLVEEIIHIDGDDI